MDISRANEIFTQMTKVELTKDILPTADERTLVTSLVGEALRSFLDTIADTRRMRREALEAGANMIDPAKIQEQLQRIRSLDKTLEDQVTAAQEFLKSLCTLEFDREDMNALAEAIQS
jgi:uncharacterized membrane protein